MTIIDGTVTHEVDQLDAEVREWAAHVSVSALQCRELRHSWPRAIPRGARSRALGSSDGIEWRVTASYADGRPAEAEREMTCTGGCGTRRIETFRFYPGGDMHREGMARYAYDPDYLRPKASPGERMAPLPADAIRGFVVRRLFPGLKW